MPPTRVSDVRELNLSENLTRSIEKTIFDNKMSWDLWIESAAGFGELRDSLKKRGYKNVPFHSSPAHKVKNKKVVKSKKEIKNITPNIAKLKPYKTMLRRKN